MIDLRFLDSPDPLIPRGKQAVASPVSVVGPEVLDSDWWHFWDERAAIREFDGGYPREHAEALALLDVAEAMARTANHIVETPREDRFAT